MNRSQAAKRLFDLVVSALGLLILSPLLAAIWLRLRLDQDGPVLYQGKRVGQGGRLFTMYKFRTMVVNAGQVGGPNTPDDDRRITKTGQVLRRYKVDELPQLFNVIRGDMSLVGPRPQVQEEVDGYSEDERGLLRVRPGITDWASIRFHNEGEILRGSPHPDNAYAELIRPEKMRLGLDYVRNATLVDDVAILISTLLLPIRSKTRLVSPTESRR